jgi:hypothetical protein
MQNNIYSIIFFRHDITEILLKVTLNTITHSILELKVRTLFIYPVTIMEVEALSIPTFLLPKKKIHPIPSPPPSTKSVSVVKKVQNIQTEIIVDAVKPV